jgi:hypothetical protein
MKNKNNNLDKNNLMITFALKTKMPINKNAFIRYLTLDKCFRNPGRMYFIEDLVDACNEALNNFNLNDKGVKKRQIQYDIQFMSSPEGFSAPIETYTYGKRKYYRYSDLKFSITQKLLPQNVVELSKEMVVFLSQFDGMAPLKEIYDRLPELKELYDIKDIEPFVEYDFNFDYEGLKNFSELFFAIMHKKVLKIDYYSYHKKQDEQIIFHPHYLKEFLHRWYVIGYNETTQKFNWVLGLERISKVEELIDKNYLPAKENIKEYFEDVIGVTKPENQSAQKILIKVHPEFENYILTRPFHGSQKNKGKDENGWRIIELNLIINEELINNLMMYIHFLKIESPETLKQKVIERMNEGLKNNK